MTHSARSFRQDGRAEEAAWDSAALALGTRHTPSVAPPLGLSFTVRVWAAASIPGVFLSFRDVTSPKGGFYYLMTRFCLVSGFRNKEKSGSQPACLDHVQDRRALTLKAHQSESHLPIGRCGGVSGKKAGGVALNALELFLPKPATGFEDSRPSAWRRGGWQSCLVVVH